MDAISFSRTDSGVHVEGFSDAIKVIHLHGPKAKRLADLALHRLDLEFAAECLAQINRLPADPPIIRQALWRSAIVHYVKCFGDPGSRFQLSAAKIYQQAPVGMANFDYFRDLRSKHFVHDENSYAQSIPGAILNHREKPNKIEKIVCFNAIAETLDQNNFGNLDLLIRKAREWVASEFDTLCEMLTTELEQESHEALARRDSISYSAPLLAEVKNKRHLP
jgi:hypothetical protein